MRLDADQLEWVVREVVRRLQTAGPTGVRTATSAHGHQAADGHGGRELVVADPVVTTRQIERKLAGVGRLRISQEAVVTPAVHDLLKSKNIQLHRGPS